MIRSARVVCATAFAVVVGFELVSQAQSPATVRVSLSSTGEQANGLTTEYALSADGRYVSFISSASNLVGGDTNGVQDVFVHDRLTGTTTRVSVSTTGGQTETPVGGAATGSSKPALSDDGRFVAFFSKDAGLVAGDAELSQDVFVRDRDVDADNLFDEPGQVQTLRATIRSDGTPGTCVHAMPTCNVIGDDTQIVGLSGNGRHVFFVSKREFDNDDLDGELDLFVHDLRTRRTTRLAEGLTLPPNFAGSSTHYSDRSGRYLLVNIATAAAGFENVGVLDRDVNGNDVFDEPGDTTLTRVPTPPGETASNVFLGAAAIATDGVLVAFNRQVSVTNELWIWHRIGNVARRIGSVSFGSFQAVRFSDDGRRLSNHNVAGDPTMGPPIFLTQIATFDADGDGHLDPQGSIGSVSVPQVGGASPFFEFDGSLRYFAFSSQIETLVPGDTNGTIDAFVHDLQSPALDTFDTDGDGLANTFETRFGLNAASSTGADGPGGDPDGDGRTNAQEQAAGTHPRGLHTRYLAEGATGSFFSTRISVANAGTQPATVLVRYQTDTGHTTSTRLAVPAQTRQFVNVGLVPSLASAAFSTVVEADVPVIVDRSMFWAEGLYGSSAETSVAAPATTWYLAEGATHGFFDLFYLVQNPSETAPATVEARFLLPSGEPVVRSYTVPPSTRMNILVDTIPGLEATDVSGVVSSTNGTPIIVERAMYFSRDLQPFRAGHASAGVTAPATTWRLAEGATGSFFDLFVLIANPSATPAEVRTTYLRPSGQPIVTTHTIAANSRLTIYVENEDPALADTPVSTVVESTNNVPIVVERAMWWPSPGGAWQEAHNSFGATQAATRWGFADGEVGPPPVNTQTYFLIANATPDEASVRVTLLFGAGPVETRDYVVAPNSRFNVPVAQDFPFAVGRGFGAVVESLGAAPVPIVVERAMYSDANGVIWAAGTNVLGTPLP